MRRKKIKPLVRALYGGNPKVLAARRQLIQSVVETFQDAFGDDGMRLFRSPGRINLRGMHVDTHGGYLNLMTHHREVVVAAARTDGAESVIVNMDDAFAPARFSTSEMAAHPAFKGNWVSFITHPDLLAETNASRGHWSNYLRGCFLSVQHRFPGRPLNGIHAAVGSDLPRGAALSSSAALCVAVILAILACNDLELSRDELILAARDAEWFTGSRCGLSDQTAMVIGGKGVFVNIAIYPPAFSTRHATSVPFPRSLRVLVINSYTERSLSGAAGVDYVRNRFAYSLAMEILRQEMARLDVPPDLIAQMDRLSNITPEKLEPVGGIEFLYELLASIPQSLTLDALRKRYHLPHLDETYNQYFGNVDKHVRPRRILLRGPLVFGIAESERARLFPSYLNSSGAFPLAGLIMTIGHEGDRCSGPKSFSHEITNPALGRLRAMEDPIELIPGVYGASSPVLDFLVDTARRAGALGASLTGAGMAGSVLALCYAHDAEAIAETIRRRMATRGYARLAGRAAPLSRYELAQAVCVNTATAPAGEIALAAR